MSGPQTPGSPPPEVPEEFAAAYRAAYEQALAAQAGGPQPREDRDPGLTGQSIHGTADPGLTPAVEGPTWFERVRDSTWFVPLLLAFLALLLIVGAYTVGRRISGHVAGNHARDAQSGVVIGEGGGVSKQPVTNQKPGAGAWKGKVSRLGGVKATASCTARAGVDSSGTPVTYDASHLFDGIAETTWRCNGSAVGDQITLDLGKEVAVGQVGLIPGYAKTDAQSNADRYAENNRVTRVRWTIGSRQVVQKLSGSPTDRSLQLLRVPRTTTDRIVLKILAVKKGPRDTTAISEVQIGWAG